MNNQDQVPTIAELWDSLSRQLCALDDRQRRLSNAEYFGKIGQFNTREEFLENCQTIDRLPPEISKIQGFVQSLRQQLVERCEVFRIGNWTISFCIAGSQLMVSQNAFTFYADQNKCNELAAIYAFWAWELEQRGKERKG